ncbi:glutamate-rich protein 6-like isoform X2 [Acanthaster planci]|uniref:Glutamate-rich protein 6-like isoform X2 n=1 Tax=Acanthaster planci TaxID=133434 RepID=A0A8B7Y626_ACAPL|nr:glutamate-rich protein 6-like isoform X2 [Acanthaster planci]
MSGGHTPLDGILRQDSLSSQELEGSVNEDGDSSNDIGEIPTPSSPQPRSSSSLTIENLRLFEEVTERSGTGSPIVLRSVQDSGRTSSPLGPVRTGGRGSPVRVELTGSSSRPSSQTRASTPAKVGAESLRTGSSKPLPPIRGEKAHENKEVDLDAKSGSSSTGEQTISTNGDRSEIRSRSSQPAILSYRRELASLNDDAERSIQTAESVTRSERSVSFRDESDTRTPAKSPEKTGRSSLKSPAIREVVRQKNPDGTERIGVSIATETEWSWLESVTLAGKGEVELKEADQTKTPPSSGFPRKRRHRKGSQSTLSYRSEGSDAENGQGKSRAESFVEEDQERRDSQSESEYSDDDVAPLPTDTLIPSIGPPRIIQYQRESDRAVAYPDSPSDRVNTAGMSGLVVPRFDSFGSSVSASSDLDGDDDLNGVCEFCQQELKTFPTPEMAQSMTPEEIYCCSDYQQLVEFTLTHGPEATYPVDELIDIQPHAPYGSKQARRAAKERAAQRMRDREIARQRAAGANQANFYALQVARQMKTINYQLSSQKCLDEGWTIRPPTPDDDDGGPPMVFLPEPVIPPPIMSQARQGIQDPKTVQKFYEDGKLFMLMFPDGTGNVFYPSGHIAVLITSVEKGQYTYLVYEDVQHNATLLAVFEPNGCSTCYHSNGNIRMNLDQYGGIFTDSKGAVKKKWSWKDQVTHVHAPPFQPICFAINKVFSLRCMAQEQVFLAFNCNMQSIRFNVGVKLKLVAPQLIPEEPIDDHALYMSEVKAYVELILDKIHNVQKFSKSPKLENLRPSLRLQHDIVRNERLKTRRGMKYTPSNGGKDAPVVTVN